MLRCLLIDDEPLPLQLLSAYADRMPELQVVGKFHDSVLAKEYLTTNQVDLIFLDIEMPHLNGIQLLNSLETKPMTIFTTAYPEFAVEGFELSAVDYLLKPFDFARFQKAVKKAVEYHQFIQSPIQVGPEPYIFVKSEYKAVKINLNDILYIEGMDSYVKIYAGGRPVLSLMSMKSMLEMLPKDDFIRVHRSYIIPISKITSIRNRVFRIGDKEIPVGGTYEEAVEKLLKH